jgi:hypothetical protein
LELWTAIPLRVLCDYEAAFVEDADKIAGAHNLSDGSKGKILGLAAHTSADVEEEGLTRPQNAGNKCLNVFSNRLLSQYRVG